MIQFFKKYKAFLFAYLLIVPIFYLLDYVDVIIIPEDNNYEIIIYAIFWGFIIALPFYHYEYLKKEKSTVIKSVCLLVLLVTTLLIDSTMNLPDNPVTILLLMIFWIGGLHVTFPRFFDKYKYYVIGVYALIFGYFTYARLFSVSFESYATTSKELVLRLMFVPIPIILLLLIFEQWKDYRALIRDKTKAELDLLKTQINPHFFFNTLNNLYTLTVKKSPEAPKIILKLSEMMRYTIYGGKKESVSLAHEIEYLENYIDLHKIRYRKTVNITFDHQVDDITAVAPLMFIVPLENAIKHGVESLSDNAYIKMKLKSDGNSLLFFIENNFDPTQINEANGIGLENLKQRLTLTYPKLHELNIEKKKDRFRLTLNLQL